jgi:hypothetical protein
LRRHILSVHTEKPKIKCPYSSCEHKKTQFCRRDKWFSHLRAHHKTELCPYAHCKSRTGSSSPWNENAAADKHFGKVHGDYECALKSCKGSLSQFSDGGLLEHLQIDHRLALEQVLKTRDVVKLATDLVVRDEHMVGITGLSDCTGCGKKQDL